ncbi:MAG TPA: amidohydrolase [Flavobacteriales bacterium]|nr:amidohydrolase [Flavobacteriales bacterium]HRO39501.1 amidohydrolase [Flavobacteriales bacterium]HRP81903.1 amidohydrolase [Flavobacteriales bacterium]HRQ84512.1 amidohydrolase [Flavobacteriales bacterium]
MQDLNVLLVQSMLQWENGPANRDRFTGLLKGHEGTTDLVVLPEMFTTGFSMNSVELAEAMDGPTVAWMRDQARKLDAALYGSVIISEGGRHFNRGLFVEPGGRVTTYDKRHLFRYADETSHFSPGRERVVVEWRGWRLLLQICFDLRFPVFARNRGDYDAILYIASWPEPRSYAWKQLLIARAIENQCYVVGVNRVGMDGKGIHYAGGSALIDPKGATFAIDPDGSVLTGRLDRASLEDFRKKFPVAMEADAFTLDR